MDSGDPKPEGAWWGVVEPSVGWDRTPERLGVGALGFLFLMCFLFLFF